MHEDALITLVYDKECPLCDNYCRLVRIREELGELVIINAREPSEIISEVTALGWDIDQGMVLKIEQQLYYGADAMHALALISSNSGFFNRIHYRIFQHPRVAALLYPLLRSIRNLTLKILGKRKINNLRLSNNSHF